LRFFFDAEDQLQHTPYLVFIGIAIAGDGLFYFFGRIFGYQHPGLHGCSDGNALGSSQLKHTLHILSEERRLDSECGRLIKFDEFAYFGMDQVEPRIDIFFFREFQHIHQQYLGLIALYAQQCETHQLRTRIDAQDDLIFHRCENTAFRPIFIWTLSPFFVKHQTPVLNKKTKIFLNYILGPVIFLWLSWAIYRQIRQQAELQQSWDFIRHSFTGSGSWKIIAVVLFMILNWAIEAWKWQLLARHIQPVSFGGAYRSVLAGQSLAFNTPNRMGEPVGRVAFLGEGNRLRGIALAVTGNISQLLVTFWGGLAGLLYLRWNIAGSAGQLRGMEWLYNGFVFVATIAAGLLLLLYYRLSWVTQKLERLKFIAKHRYLIAELENFHRSELTRILALSACRYVVFMVQYVLLLQVFEVRVSAADTVCMVSVMFLVITIIPSVSFAELGFRGQISLQLFGLLSANSLGIIATTAGIWVVNMVVPAVAGSLFLLGLRLFRTKKEDNK